MKLHVLSDLHIEFLQFIFPCVESDIVILAGDIHVGINGVKWAIENIKNKPVIYVLGNHEYYGNTYPKLLFKMKEVAKGTNIHILENDFICIDNVVFLGCTLWSNFELFGDHQLAAYRASQQLADYKKIRVSPKYSKLKSIDTLIIHKKSINWLEESLKKINSSKIVVVTHHAPSKKSIPEQYKDDILSAAYASDLSDLVSSSQAFVWIHGHVHDSCNYEIGETKIICNPRGYPDEMNQFFDPELIVNI